MSEGLSLKSGAATFARSMAPLGIFYAFDWTLGVRAAVVASAVWSMGEVIWRLARKEKIDILFKFTAATSFVFGGLDIVITQPRFFSYEAVVTNLVTGVFFAVMARTDITPMLAQVHALRPELAGEPEIPLRVRVVVAACALLCFIKALVYLWIALAFSVERAMTLRSIVGTASIVLFVGALRFTLEPVMAFAKRRGILQGAP